MKKHQHPLGEVFGYQVTDFSAKAVRSRKNKLCPFNNKVPNCTKDKAQDPLGVCCVTYDNKHVITCPVRFREDWLIAEDAADFFFGEDATWTSLTEVRLTDQDGKSAGNIDVVLVAYDDKGQVYDFGSLEIQAVYISGNVRNPFQFYMSDCKGNQNMDWTKQVNYPRPDFLSSSRKRLAPQLLFKGGILNAWNKKMAVALDKAFFDTLPTLEEVTPSEAEMVWLVYDLCPSEDGKQLALTRFKKIYTKFNTALNTITRPRVGQMNHFMQQLQSKVDEQLKSSPTTRTIDSPI